MYFHTLCMSKKTISNIYNLNPRILYLVKIYFKNYGKMNTFTANQCYRKYKNISSFRSNMIEGRNLNVHKEMKNSRNDKHKHYVNIFVVFNFPKGNELLNEI